MLRIFLRSITIPFLIISSGFYTLTICQILPTDVLQNGYAVVSCFANSGTDPSIAVIDMTQAGVLHDNTANHGSIDLSANFPKTKMWLLNEFEGNQILATAIDKRDGAIYATSFNGYENATSIFIGDAKVYYISPNGNTVTLFATLPGGISGGWMDIDEVHNQLYVSNFDDGMIYIVPISAGPAIPNTFNYQTFAPHPSQMLNDVVAPLGQRIWSVGYNTPESRLYYSIWGQDTDQSSGLTNDVRSIAIDATGNFLPATDQFELTAPLDNFFANNGTSYNTNMPVSDIEFNSNGTKMLLAEQSYNTLTLQAGAHDSRVLEYNGSAGNWLPEPVNKHSIGNFANFGLTTNARGGVDFLYHDIDANNNANGKEDYIVATGDALPLDNANGIFIYGLQIHRIAGGNQNTSIKVDLDGATNNIGDKYVYGDIDVRALPNCINQCINSFGEFTIIKRIE